MTALSILLLAFVGCAVAGVLVFLALEHRARLQRIEEKQDAHAKAVAERLNADRACMLRDMTEPKRKIGFGEDERGPTPRT